MPEKSKKIRRRALVGGAVVVTVALGGVLASVVAEQRAAEEARVAEVAVCNDELRATIAALAPLDGVVGVARALYERTADRLAGDDARSELSEALVVASAKVEQHPQVCDAELSTEAATALAQEVVSTREAVPAASRTLADSKGRVAASLVALYAADVAAARAELASAVPDATELLAASEGRVLEELRRETLAGVIASAETALAGDADGDLNELAATLVSLERLQSDLYGSSRNLRHAVTAWELEQERIAAERAAEEARLAEERAAQERAAARQRQISSLGLARAEVLRVIDGDTIEVSVDGRTEWVRFIGVDAPRSARPVPTPPPPSRATPPRAPGTWSTSSATATTVTGSTACAVTSGSTSPRTRATRSSAPRCGSAPCS